MMLMLFLVISIFAIPPHVCTVSGEAALGLADDLIITTLGPEPVVVEKRAWFGLWNSGPITLGPGDAMIVDGYSTEVLELTHAQGMPELLK